jgi:hypothetical protein
MLKWILTLFGRDVSSSVILEKELCDVQQRIREITREVAYAEHFNPLIEESAVDRGTKHEKSRTRARERGVEENSQLLNSLRKEEKKLKKKLASKR